MTYQDVLFVAIVLTIIVFVLLFSDGGPGTPKRIRIPIPVRSSNWPA